MLFYIRLQRYHGSQVLLSEMQTILKEQMNTQGHTICDNYHFDLKKKQFTIWTYYKRFLLDVSFDTNEGSIGAKWLAPSPCNNKVSGLIAILGHYLHGL